MVAAGPGMPAAAIVAQEVPPPAAIRTPNPASRRRKLRCVITAYQIVAGRTGSRDAWSASRSTVEPPAISSQASRKVTASAAAGTSCMPTAKTANAVHPVREAAGPCA